MTDVNTIINMPTIPEEIGISLPSDQLRRIDFSALDFESLRRMTVEYVRTYFADDFNDFFLSNGYIMLMEIVAANANILSERSDIIADEGYLSTAQSRTAVSQHLQLIGQNLNRATSSTVNVECSIPISNNFDTIIPAGLIFNISGPDNNPVFYELYSAPGDFNNDIIIPRGKRGTIAFGIEGKFSSPIQVISNGENNQVIDITNKSVLDEPIIITINSGESEEQWSRYKFIQLAGPNDNAYEVRHLDDRTQIIFGDNLTGKSPIQGQVITVKYRTGGGKRGRIGTNAIDEARPIAQGDFVTQNVIFRNVDTSIGGRDEESLESAKRRAPKQYSTHNNAATPDDYINLSEGFSHPVFGIVAKASAAIRTGIDADINDVVEKVRQAPNKEIAKTYLLGNYVNRNIVELYILQNDSNELITPSTGLKQALNARLSSVNVFTDELRILDGLLRPINIDARIIVSRNVDAAIVKEQVDFAINEIFNPFNIRMGQGFNKSELITAIQSVPGVRSVTLFSPSDDYPSLNYVINDNDSDNDNDKPLGIGVNEIYILGSQNVQFFYERGNLSL